MSGRKTKLNKKLIDNAVALLEKGNYVVTICEYLGIDESTWYRWIREGKEEGKGIKYQFYQAIQKAEAQAEIQLLDKLQNIAEQDFKWQAIAWMLERKYPDRWGKKDRISADVQHSGEVTERHEQHTKIDVRHRVEKYEDVIDELVKEEDISAFSRDHS